MKSRIHPNLSLSLCLLGLTSAGAFAQALAPEDFFHDGAGYYLSNNVSKALEVVSSGRALFPDDIKLRQLEELLRQQDPQPQAQQDQQQQDQQQQQPQQEQQDQPEAQPSPEEQKEGGQPEEPSQTEQQVAPGQMTPEEARRLLDAQRGDEQVLQFRPEGKPKDANRPFKDW